MNLPPPLRIAGPATPAADDGDDINLLSVFDVVLDSRWLIASVASVVLLAGGAYAFLASPVYEADSLIQVENTKPGSAGALGDAGALFDIQSPATAEMEILRSRLVVGEAVDQLHLYISATPRYVPWVGGWLARQATGLSEPGVFGHGGYVSGKESITVRQLEVPKDLEGVPLILTVTDKGFELHDPEGGLLAKGVVGKVAPFAAPETTGSILVTHLEGNSGAEFVVRRDSRLAVVQRLQSSLSISEKGRQSGVIGVSLQGTDPQTIARTLVAVGSSYVRQNVDRKAAEAEKSLSFLDNFLPQLKVQMEESEGKFTAFRDKNGTFNLTSEGDQILQQSAELQTRLLDLQQKRKELEALFTAEHPRMKTIDAQIASISAELKTLATKAKALPDTEQNLLRLTRDVKVNNDLYTNLLNSLQQLRLVKEGKVGNVRVVDAPAVPRVPIKPKRAQILAISAALGVLAGLGLALMRSSMRRGIKDASEIESSIGMNVFATVPYSGKQKRLDQAIRVHAQGNHLLALAKPGDPSVESLRSLRTALQFAMLDAKNNIVLMTGPTPGIGKSFTSANFAAILGAGGKRVLLIDADLRKGHLHQYFGLQREDGLSSLISGRIRLEQALKKNVAPNVDLITTGQLPPNPGDLLLSPVTGPLIKALAGHYDLVLVDTPPVLAVSDTQVLATTAGTVFLIARADVSTLGELQESGRRLGQSGVVAKGVIFNGVNIDRKRYGYGKYSPYRPESYEYAKLEG